MKAKEFSKELSEEIKDMPEEDRNQINEYFEEMIYDSIEGGEAEEEVIKKIGTPKEVAVKLRSEYGQLIVNQKKEGTKNCEEYQSHKPVELIEVWAQDTPVLLCPYSGRNIQVQYRPRHEIEEFFCEEKDGSFHITQRYKKGSILGLWLLGGLHFNRGPITVYIPKVFHGTLQVRTSNARVSVQGYMEAERVSLHTSNGGISVGDIQSVNTAVETSNGRIEVSNVQCKGIFRAATSNSRILAENISGTEINLRTSNGEIRGSFNGCMRDYSIVSHTSNASNNLPERMSVPGAPILRATTSNGKIQIEFTES